MNILFAEISMDAEQGEDGEVDNGDTSIELRPSMSIFAVVLNFAV